jgi:hypothetical protein
MYKIKKNTSKSNNNKWINTYVDKMIPKIYDVCCIVVVGYFCIIGKAQQKVIDSMWRELSENEIYKYCEYVNMYVSIC